MGDFVEVREVNPVIQLAHVRECLRGDTLPDELVPLVDGYLIVEGANAAAVHGLLSALPQGGAFLLSGVYGTGKSHLLAWIGLLAEFPDARQRFAQNFPTWMPLVQPLADQRFFVAYISLDEYDPGAVALETAIARELATEAHRKNFFVPTDTTARGEWLHQVWSIVREKGFAGLVILLDELAMFLNAKSGDALHRDASFLQFLAQATRRLPLLLVGALQRGVEDLQRIEPYALTQVRDRFQQPWVLGFAHALPLINQVLLHKRREAELRQLLSSLREQATWAQRFSLDELFASYPFHPFTVRCLERSTGAFFSRTRSIVTFVQRVVRERLHAQWHELVTPDAFVDHFEPDMPAHPQLRPFAQTVLPYFATRRWGADSETVTKLAKTMLAFQLGGEEPSARLLADALMRDANEVWALLEQLRTDANFVDAVKRTGSPDDTYRLDPQITVTDALRRCLTEVMQTLSDDDPRLVRFAWECRGEEWSPPPLFEPRTLTVRWLRTQRRILVTVTDLRRLTEAQLRQTVATLASPHTEECLHLFVALPIAVAEQVSHFAQLLEQLSKQESLATERFAHAVVALLPRPPNDAERRRWCENTAVWLLSQDLSLAESELGMKVLERTREMLSARQWETQRLLQRLYAEGRAMGHGAGKGQEMSKALGTEFASFDELVQAAAEEWLPKVFPLFPQIAPRRETSSQTIHTLTRLILRRLPASAMDVNAQRWLELVAMPLGIVARHNGQLVVAVPKTELTDALMSAVGEGAMYRQVEATLAKSEWGLTPELTQLLIAASLRCGWLTAFDRDGKPLAPETLSVPLSRSVAWLKPTEVLSGEEWLKIRPLLAAVLDDVPEQLTPEKQHRLWTQLREQAKGWKLTLQDVNARLAQWQRELLQSEQGWRRTTEHWQLGAEIVSLTEQPLSAADGLRLWANGATQLGLDAERLRRWRSDFEAIAEFFASSAEILSAWRYLNALGQLPENLAERQIRLLRALQEGEALVSRWGEWLESFRQFRNDYASAYIAHHETVHAGEGVRELQQLQQSDGVRVLRALSALPEAPECGREALQRLDGALEQVCSETSLNLRAYLQRSPFCPRCGLTLDKLPSVDVSAVAQSVHDALSSLKEWLCGEEQKGKLACFLEVAPPPDRPLLERVLALKVDSDERQWLVVLTALPLLQKALSPFAVVEADLDELCKLLEGRYLTSEEAAQVFRDWVKSKAPSPDTRLRFLRHHEERDIPPKRQWRQREPDG